MPFTILVKARKKLRLKTQYGNSTKQAKSLAYKQKSSLGLQWPPAPFIGPIHFASKRKKVKSKKHIRIFTKLAKTLADITRTSGAMKSLSKGLQRPSKEPLPRSFPFFPPYSLPIIGPIPFVSKRERCLLTLKNC